MRKIVLIAHSIRSAHNVGSMLRTADGLGIDQVYLTGYTPYPKHKDDKRLPHLATRIDKQVAKTALGAEKTVNWQHDEDIKQIIKNLRTRGFTIAALEQAPESTMLPNYKPSEKIAVIVGREVEGIEPEILECCDLILEIPMQGKKESFNVAVSAAMALFHLSFSPM